jgi:hypothetical protein
MSIEKQKRPYQTPEIVDFGQMEELTRAVCSDGHLELVNGQYSCSHS